MKLLLLIYNYEAGFPFIQDIEKNLKLQPGIEVDVLDTNNLVLRQHKGGKKNLAGSLGRKLVRLPKIGFRIKIILLRRVLAHMKGKYDVVNIHNCDLIYTYLMPSFRAITDNVYPMMWGSDFYRASEMQRTQKKAIFDASRYIIFANPVNARDFIAHYQDYREKAIINGFGVAKFDSIKEVSEKESIESLKKSFDLPTDKIIVAVGYNGTKGQQHVKLLDEIAQLPADIKSRLFLVLQMTYGFQQDYCNEVEGRAAALGLDYRVLKEFFDDEKTSRLRLAIDVVLNAQITDGFSSSIQEHIFAGNIVVVGDWLPYQPLELAQIFYLRTPLDGFGSKLVSVVEKYDEMKAATQGNSEKIYRLSSWSNRIKSWVSIYRGEGEKFLYQEHDMKIS
jgi:hypothetical protein